MEKAAYLCDQCGEPVKLEGFACQTDQGFKKFCCEGCLSIYRLLHPDLNPKNTNQEDLKL
ncbi:MAG: metal-binding protein [Methylococcaceae bacterium]|jgi:hypothetical protein|nr:metal-binding protein [Methylococcaceae bacterium]